MSIEYKAFSATGLNSAVTLYTVPANKAAIISAVILGNTDSNPQTVDNVSVGGVAVAQDYVVPPTGTTLSAVEGQILEAGQVLSITATGGFINARFSLKVIEVV